MILFGLAEIVTSFRHEFFGLTTSQAVVSTIIGAVIGLLYFVSGLLVLTKRRRAAIAAIILLVADVVGRITMALSGLYPLNSGMQTLSIIAGTLIVIFFAIYINLRLRYFQ
jgi:hypothetical protein